MYVLVDSDKSGCVPYLRSSKIMSSLLLAQARPMMMNHLTSNLPCCWDMSSLCQVTLP